MLTVTGSPSLPFADALVAVLTADAVLTGLASSGIYASLPRGVRTVPPYIVIGRREMDDVGGAMQVAGGQARVVVEVWSNLNGPAEAQQMQSRIRALLMRRTLPVSGFLMIDGSLTCVHERVELDFDPDMPERSLFHGVQEWVADLEESL